MHIPSHQELKFLAYLFRTTYCEKLQWIYYNQLCKAIITIEVITISIYMFALNFLEKIELFINLIEVKVLIITDYFKIILTII